VNLVRQNRSWTADAGVATIRIACSETNPAIRSKSLVHAGDFDRGATPIAGDCYLDLLQRAEAEAETSPTDEWLAEYAPMIDNVRAALDWAFFSPGCDVAIGGR